MPFDTITAENTQSDYVAGETQMLWLDWETYNAFGIDRGAHRYAETAEIIVGAYAFDDGDVWVWDEPRGHVYRLVFNQDSPTAPLKPSLEFAYVVTGMPADLRAALDDDTVLITAHNAMFDRQIVERVTDLCPRLERWRCSMVKAYSHAYPGGLETVGKLLKLPNHLQKLDTGKKLIRLFCMPQPKNHKVRRHTHETRPAEWAEFLLYGAIDIAAMREVSARLPSWNWRDSDIALWHLDQRINDRGIGVDRELVKAGAEAAAIEATNLAEEFCTIVAEFALPDGHLAPPGTPKQRDKFKAYLNTRFGLNLDNTRKDTFQPLVDGGDLDPAAHRLMEISILANKTSTAKYAALYPAIQDDDSYRGGLQFRGAARTRRYAGRLFQAQNLPSRGLPDQHLIDAYVVALKAGLHDLLFGDLMLYGSAALRSCIIARAKYLLAVADLSNIEGRIVAWLAGEVWKLKAFIEYDNGLGPDLYKITASNILGGTPDDVSKTNRNVFGKVPELACGYEGGFGAFQTFAKGNGLRTRDGRSMSNYSDTIYDNADKTLISSAKGNWGSWGEERNPDADEDEWLACEVVKLAWRRRHPATVKLWKLIKEAAHNATKHPGKSFKAGQWLSFCIVRHAGIPYLLCRLPSGAFLCYAEPKISRTDGTLTYMGLDTTVTGGGAFGQWTRLYTYGGKLLENSAQSIALDVMMANAPAIEKAGYQIILSVHDELLAEVVESGDHVALAEIMARVPAWARGLPLAADGFTTPTYRKG